jgi:hypothetical protein
MLRLGMVPVLGEDQVPPADAGSSSYAATGWATVIPGASVDYLLLFDGVSAPRCFMLATFVETPLAAGYDLFATALTLVHDFDAVRMVAAAVLVPVYRLSSHWQSGLHAIVCRTGTQR